MEPLWIETFRYHRWANLHLLDACEGLGDEELAWTAPGTYGTLGATLQHLLGAEQRYIQLLGGSAPRLNEKQPFPGIARLKELAAESGDELIELAGKVGPEEWFEQPFAGANYKLHRGVVIIQALHHGNDHRTHACTILGHHGREYGEMDVWAYGEASGAITPIGAV